MIRDGDLWGEGYVEMPRALFRTALWRTLSVEQRQVVQTIWRLANYRPAGFMYGTRRIDVGRGELAHSLSEIAREAGVTPKVVRTTIRRLMAGSPWDGIGPLLGTTLDARKGRSVRVLRVLHYERIRSTSQSAGTLMVEVPEHARADHGQAEGTTGAPREEGKHGKQEDLLAPPQAADRDPPSVENGEGDRRHPDSRHAAFIEAASRIYVDIRGEALVFDGSDGRQLAGFLRKHPAVALDEFTDRWSRSLTARYRRCSRVRELISNWGHHAPGLDGSGMAVARFDDYSGPVDFQTGRPIAAEVAR